MKLELTFKPDLENVNLVRKLCQRFFGNDTDIILAVTEALNNAVLHTDTPYIELNAKIIEREILVSIKTQCREFNSSKPVEPASMDDLPEHGYGLALIQETTDKVEHKYIDGKNILTLHKSLPSNIDREEGGRNGN